MATKEDAKKIIGNIRSSYLDKSEDSWCRQNLSQALPMYGCLLPKNLGDRF